MVAPTSYVYLVARGKIERWSFGLFVHVSARNHDDLYDKLAESRLAISPSELQILRVAVLQG